MCSIDLRFIRNLLRRNVSISVQYLDRKQKHIGTITAKRSDKNVTIVVSSMFGGTQRQESFWKASQTLLNTIRQNHNICIKTLYNEAQDNISIEWDSNVIPFENLEYAMPTVFGAFPSEQERLEFNESLKTTSSSAYNVSFSTLEARVDEYAEKGDIVEGLPDMTLDENSDVYQDITVHDYLRAGEIPPPYFEFKEGVDNLIQSAIVGGSVESLQWTLNDNPVKQYDLYYAMKYGTEDVARYLCEQYHGHLFDRFMVYAARFSKDFADWIHQRFPSAHQTLTTDIFKYKWNTACYIYEHHGSTLSLDKTVWQFDYSPEQVRYFVEHDAPLEPAARMYVRTWERLSIILDKDPSLVNCSAKALFSWERGEEGLIFARLIEKGLRDWIPLITKQWVAKAIADHPLVQQMIYEHHPKLCMAFVKVGQWDIDMLTYEFQRNPNVVVQHLIQQNKPQIIADLYGKDIPKNIHYAVMARFLHPAFTAFRSIAKNHFKEYRAAKIFFQRCANKGIPIVEDDDGAFMKMERKYKEYTFSGIPNAMIVPNGTYRVIVFSMYEKDGLPTVLYDIQNATCQTTFLHVRGFFVYRMRGTNNGPLPHSYERNWVDQEDSFELYGTKEGFPNEFTTGRDGGSLTCGGNYWIKIIKVAS